MSNTLHIIPTKFEDARSGEISYGVRVADDYGKTYENMWESIPDDDMDVLKETHESLKQDEIFRTMMEFITENGKGLYIGNTWYDWDELKPALEELGYDCSVADPDDGE